MQLLERTYKLLSESDVPKTVIARRTGLGYEWLNALSQGKIQDPGIKKIQALHDYLIGKRYLG